jgi:NDP-sugar pyrophosphorylase family protein
MGLMTVYKNNNKIEPSNVEIRGKHVIAYDKKNPDSKMKYIDYGVSIFRKEVLKLVPSKKFCDLSYLHKELIKQQQLLAYLVSKRYYQIGTLEGLEEFKQYAQKFLTKSKIKC